MSESKVEAKKQDGELQNLNFQFCNELDVLEKNLAIISEKMAVLNADIPKRDVDEEIKTSVGEGLIKDLFNATKRLRAANATVQDIRDALILLTG